jgi:branched-chain amino acid transport system ATP-binding protein
MPDGDIILDAKNVTIRFGGLTAVSNFALTIRDGELVGLIGPNGAGKTTIFNMLTGVYKPTEGEIRVGDHTTANMKPYQITARGVARTFQNIRLFKELSVLDNVKIGGHIHYKYSGTTAVLHTNRFFAAEQVAEDEALKLLGIFGLEDRAQYLAKNLPRSRPVRVCSSSTNRQRDSTPARRSR